MSEDYYSMLEVEHNASQDDIKRAYRRLAMKYHPDRNNGDKTAEEKFKQIGTAYEVLGDPEKRRIYDQVGHEAYTQPGHGAPGGGGPGMDFGDLGDIFGGVFGNMFGGGRRRRDPNAPVDGQDLEYQLRISFEDAAYGTDKTISFTIDDACNHCHGSGGEPGSSRKTCPRCNGRGQILTSAGGFFQMQQTCPQCQGRGTIIEKPCTSCHGSGQMRSPRKVEFHIPAGVDTGSRIRLSGKGASGRNGGQPGDLYVTLQVAPHDLFSRDGADLKCSVPIPFHVAALGGEVEVPTLNGKYILKVPAGTQNGTEFRISSKGLPIINRRGTGDLYVKILVEVPSGLSSEQKKLLKAFAESCGRDNHPKMKTFQEKASKFL